MGEISLMMSSLHRLHKRYERKAVFPATNDAYFLYRRKVDYWRYINDFFSAKKILEK